MEQQRSTRQQRALDEVLAASSQFRSAQDIHSGLRDTGSKVGLTTVYTRLRALAERGLLDTLRTDSGETLYRRCDSTSHHHHLMCRVCGRTDEVAAPEVEEWAEAIARGHGYVEVSHTVEIIGTCAACAAAARG